jgi:hypothetical protein
LRVTNRRKIGFRDNDAAGAALVKFTDECRVTDVKDLGDSTDEEIRELVKDLL